MRTSERRKILTGLAFAAPNILGFLVFTLIPLILSLMMAFTNWDLRLHNMFKDTAPRFIGLENFIRLFKEPHFAQSLGNTIFMMMAIPVGIGGSLCAALLLSRDLKAGRSGRPLIFATGGLLVGLTLILLAGGDMTALVLLIMGVAALVLFGGVYTGQTVYRTLFYFPHFTAGVATFLLWKKLYNPHTGPINTFLRPPLAWLEQLVNALPPEAVRSLSWLVVAVGMAVIALMARRARRDRRDGELGVVPVCLVVVNILLPCVLYRIWDGGSPKSWTLLAVGLAASAAPLSALFRKPDFRCLPDEGIGRSFIENGALMIVVFICVGLAFVFDALPRMASDGLNPPEWLTRYHWAKPSLMLMGVWAALGSNNMLLYLAGISNIPPELYEAADIDGAQGMQRFWHITWPQLAPVTFFIFVMSMIGGLQGGFEQARTMTEGGPARATTTLSYYVYQEGFETGRLGYASAVAWTLFALIFAITLVNWKYGNRRMSE